MEKYPAPAAETDITADAVIMAAVLEMVVSAAASEDAAEGFQAEAAVLAAVEQAENFAESGLNAARFC